jgi:hypothetical protein
MGPSVGNAYASSITTERAMPISFRVLRAVALAPVLSANPRRSCRQRSAVQSARLSAPGASSAIGGSGIQGPGGGSSARAHTPIHPGGSACMTPFGKLTSRPLVGDGAGIASAAPASGKPSARAMCTTSGGATRKQPSVSIPLDSI